jgi:xylulose-5-phosphate/fructose-6-phosphate phosphoketolase
MPGAGALLAHCQEMLDRHHEYVREHLDDMPEIRDWTWS